MTKQITSTSFGRIRIELREQAVRIYPSGDNAYQTVVFIDDCATEGTWHYYGLNAAMAWHMAHIAKMKKKYDSNHNYPDKR